MGSDPSRAGLILTARAGERWRRPLPAGRAGAESRQQHRRGQTHKGKKKHLLSLSEGMDLGRQQGSSLRNRCFSAFLV